MPSTSKPCHNCRRRRLRCDRSWPTCHKCAVSGQECLGYGKVFVWTTQAIDSQGNLKPTQSSRHATDFHVSAASSTAASPIMSSSSDMTLPPSNPHQGQAQPLMQTNESMFPAVSPEPGTASAMVLTDPVFQDLDRPSRSYLAYFADRVCQDLVGRDSPGSNPFRELLPMTRKHPLLLQILIATSAIHWSNIIRPITDISTGLTDPGGYLASLRSRDLVSRQALIDALTAKQKAMVHMREVLDTLDPAGSEVALAAMHFFIKFDLIDVEKKDPSSWKAHLEGAASIMALLTPDNMKSSSSRTLRDCVIADCFIYHIFGSTLSSGGLAARIAKYAFDLLPVMKRVEVTSSLSCPPEILQIILMASQLSYDTPCTDTWSLPPTKEALSLIDQALTFDIPAWAEQLRQIPHITDVESRVHVASAHRSAACLYILQALPLVRSLRPVDTDLLVKDILEHVGALGHDDPYFKASSWPTFIAGAETCDAETRTWTLKRLLDMWETCRWGYIFTAIEMLKATWQLQDAAARAGHTDSRAHWLQDLKGLGFEHLIV
ncbi:unnamed protein product [Clonostachys solani]|uniref:Zn(2)-C6 fungal-type domain-containing protein n=1 Tax=Clonostachys solani TaxID=160281 RepID=A0A9P0EIA0_9HYPO|nr:unnamed protein product [Clonostachys solani]